MKLEIIAKRIAGKTNCPALYDILLGQKDQSALPESCLVWTGKKKKRKPIVKMQRGWDYRPFLAPSIQQPRAIMRFNKKDVYVHRFLIEKISPPPGEYIASNVCGTPFCVNPRHWLVSPKMGEVRSCEDEPSNSQAHSVENEGQQPSEFNVDNEELWPENEVEQSIDYYLCVNPGPIDPNHDLLIDIPRQQLLSVCKKMAVEDRLILSVDDGPVPENEIEECLDYYLCVNPGPIDPEHELLVDIPTEQLVSVAKKIGRGHRLVEKYGRMI